MDDLILAHLKISPSDIEVGKYITHGSCGAVFTGVLKGKKKEQVAIKMIRTQGRELLSDICRELNTMASLQYENICRVHGGSIVNDNELWLVLEYIKGGNLRDFLATRSPIPLSQQLSFSLQAAKALHFLHKRPSPILHRDIKSLNFLVKDSTTLLLTDFGLSKMKEYVTASTTTVGTLQWAAPEVLDMFNKQWSEKADVYSLGMVMYEIVSGLVPFIGEANNRVLVEKIKKGERPTLPPDCMKEVAELIEKCWNSSPVDRPTTQQLVEVLETLSSNLKIAQTPMPYTGIRISATLPVVDLNTQTRQRNAKELEEIRSSITGLAEKVELVQPERFFILKDQFDRVFTGTGGTLSRPYCIFLFSDMILLARKGRKLQYQYLNLLRKLL